MCQQHSRRCPCTSVKVSCTRGRPGPRPARRSPAVASPWQRNLRFHCSRAGCWGDQAALHIMILSVRGSSEVTSTVNNIPRERRAMTKFKLFSVMVFCYGFSCKLLVMKQMWILVPVTFSDTFISCDVVSSVKVNQHLGSCFLKNERNTQTYEFVIGSVHLCLCLVSIRRGSEVRVL